MIKPIISEEAKPQDAVEETGEEKSEPTGVNGQGTPDASVDVKSMMQEILDRDDCKTDDMCTDLKTIAKVLGKIEEKVEENTGQIEEEEADRKKAEEEAAAERKRLEEEQEKAAAEAEAERKRLEEEQQKAAAEAEAERKRIEEEEQKAAAEAEAAKAEAEAAKAEAEDLKKTQDELIQKVELDLKAKNEVHGIDVTEECNICKLDAYRAYCVSRFNNTTTKRSMKGGDDVTLHSYRVAGYNVDNLLKDQADAAHINKVKVELVDVFQAFFPTADVAYKKPNNGPASLAPIAEVLQKDDELRGNGPKNTEFDVNAYAQELVTGKKNQYLVPSEVNFFKL